MEVESSQEFVFATISVVRPVVLDNAEREPGKKKKISSGGAEAYGNQAELAKFKVNRIVERVKR